MRLSSEVNVRSERGRGKSIKLCKYVWLSREELVFTLGYLTTCSHDIPMQIAKLSISGTRQSLIKISQDVACA
jgi:hypothetical protein